MFKMDQMEEDLQDLKLNEDTEESGVNLLFEFLILNTTPCGVPGFTRKLFFFNF